MPLDDEARRKAGVTKRERSMQKIREAVLALLGRMEEDEITYKLVSEESGMAVSTIYRYYPRHSALIYSGFEAMGTESWEPKNRMFEASLRILITMEDAPLALKHWRTVATETIERGVQTPEEVAMDLYRVLLGKPLD